MTRFHRVAAFAVFGTAFGLLRIRLGGTLVVAALGFGFWFRLGDAFLTLARVLRFAAQSLGEFLGAVGHLVLIFRNPGGFDPFHVRHGADRLLIPQNVAGFG